MSDISLLRTLEHSQSSDSQKVAAVECNTWLQGVGKMQCIRLQGGKSRSGGVCVSSCVVGDGGGDCVF